MARQKKILVKDLLAMMYDTEQVQITFFAYGIWHSDSWNDGLRTVKDCKEQLKYDWLNARAGRIENREDRILIGAELVH